MSDTVRGVKIWNRHFMLSCCNPWYSETCARHALEIGWDSLNGRHLRGSRACHPFLYLSLYHPPVAGHSGHSGHSGRSGRSCPGCMASFSAICKTLSGCWQGIIAVGYGSNAGFPQDVMIYYTRIHTMEIMGSRFGISETSNFLPTMELWQLWSRENGCDPCGGFRPKLELTSCRKVE